MKRLLTILLVIISVSVYGQKQPQPSGTLVPLSTNQAYFRASDSTYYFYNGVNYLWNYFLNKQQADRLYAPYGSPSTTPFSLSTGYGLSGSSFNGSAARTFTADTTSATGLVSKSRLATNLTGYVPKTTTLTINGSTRDLSTNRIWNVGTVLSVGATAGTGISIAGTSPITSSGTYTITNTAPDQTVVLNAGTGISTSGTYPNFTITNTAPSPTLGTSAISLGGTANGLSYSAGNYRLHRATSSTGGVFTASTDTIGGLKNFYDNINLGKIGTSGKVSFRRSSDGAIASIIEQTNDNKLTLTSSGGTKLFDINADTVMISALTNGLVKSTSGKLSNAVAGTDYLTPTGSGSGLSGVVLTTTNQTIGGTKTFSSSIYGTSISLTNNINAAGAYFEDLNGGFGFTPGSTEIASMEVAVGANGYYDFRRNSVSKWNIGFIGSTRPDSYRINNPTTTATSLEIVSATDAATFAGTVSSTPQGTLYGTASGSITSAQLATSLTDETGTGSAVFSASPTLTTPNIGVATFTTLTGGTASTITFANTSAGGIQDAISIRNGGTTAGTGNRINFITGTATQSARIASSLTSSTDANLVFSTMTGGTIGEAGRFLGDKTLQLTGALTGTSATFSSTLTSIAFIKTASGEWGTFNNTASGASSASYYQNYGTDSGSGVIRWYVGQNAFRTDGSFAIQNVSGTGLYLTSGSTSWTSTSDERSKDIIRPITNALNDINSWRTVIGKYKNDEIGKERIFLIAQDILVTTPQVVDVSDEGNLGLRYLEIIPVLVKGIQELKAEIEILKQK